MSDTHRLRLPLDERTARALKLGDTVMLEGEIVMCAGLPTHQRVLEYLDAGRPLPIDLRGAALLHLASFSREANGRFEVLYMNPTTSTRFNAFMPRLIRSFGLHAVGGKGGLDNASAAAMKDAGCVYLALLGGGSTLHAQAIQEIVSVHWDDLIPHYRLVTLRVQNLGPATVAIDAQGNSLYDTLQRAAADKLPEILAELDAARGAPAR